MLDALRFFAEFFVVLYHYGSEAPVALDQVHPVFLRGYLATDFFLMLSGYVMGRAYGPSVGSGKVGGVEFFVRRVARIWPGHLIMLGAFAALILVTGALNIQPSHPEWFDWSNVVPQALLIQAWGDFGGGGWNLPSWSLSALVVCYAAFPLAWKALGKVASPYLSVALAVAGLVGADLICRAAYGRPIYDIPFPHGVLRAAPLFLLGLAISQLVQRTVVSRRAATVLGFGAAGVFVALQALGRFDFWSVMCIAAIVAAGGAASVRRPSKVAEEGAQLSYALFITHVFAGTLWFGTVHKFAAGHDFAPALRWMIWGGALPFALAFAYAFDRVIDSRVQAWLKPRLKWRRAPRPAPAPSV